MMEFSTVEEVVESIIDEAAGIVGNPTLNWNQCKRELERMAPRYSDIIRDMNDWDNGIVLCRDCKHHDEGRCYADQWSTASLMPAHEVAPDGFCAWGERK